MWDKNRVRVFCPTFSNFSVYRAEPIFTPHYCGIKKREQSVTQRRRYREAGGYDAVLCRYRCRNNLTYGYVLYIHASAGTCSPHSLRHDPHILTIIQQRIHSISMLIFADRPLAILLVAYVLYGTRIPTGNRLALL